MTLGKAHCYIGDNEADTWGLEKTTQEASVRPKKGGWGDDTSWFGETTNGGTGDGTRVCGEMTQGERGDNFDQTSPILNSASSKV